MKAAAGSSDDTLGSYEIIPHIQLQDDLPKQKIAIHLPCIMLESHDPGRFFFGQQHILDAIEEALVTKRTSETGGPELRQFALCGLGGMGKTEIALEFAHRHQHSFDAVFWVCADEPAKLDECYLNMSVKLGLESAEEATNQVVSRSLVKGWLANPVRGDSKITEDISSTVPGEHLASWLIIFDNADDPKLLGDYWSEGPGSVLVTSRDPLAKRLFSSRSSGMDLEPLSEVDGGTLFLKLAKSDEIDTGHAAKMAQTMSKLLAGLPLAISQMAGITRRHNLDLAELLSLYEQREDRAALYSMKYSTSTRSYQHSIATVWAFEKLSAGAKDFLKLTFFLDPDSIPEHVIFDGLALQLSDPPLARARFDEVLTELSQSSLIKRDGSRNEQVPDYRVSVHRLVQDAIGAEMTEEELASAFESTVKVLWRLWPAAMPPPTKPSGLFVNKAADIRYQLDRYPICAALYPHVLRLKQIWPSLPTCSDDVKVQFAALLCDAAWSV